MGGGDGESWERRSFGPGPPVRLRLLFNLLIAGSTALFFLRVLIERTGGEERRASLPILPVYLRKSMAFCLERLKLKISDLQFLSVLNVGDPTLSFVSPRRKEQFSRWGKEFQRARFFFFF